jgi:hypothetical protein
MEKKDTFASDLKKIMHLLLSGKKRVRPKRPVPVGPCICSHGQTEFASEGGRHGHTAAKI